MSFSFGGGKKTTNTATEPWKPAIPYLTDFLGDLSRAGSGLGGITPGQTAAFGELRTNADQAGRFVPDIERLTSDLFNTTSTSGTVGDAYRRLEGQLGDFASGARTDPRSDPTFQALLTSVGDDATDRVNALFAGAGRGLSAGHVGELGREVTRAQLPIISDAYHRNVDRQLAAASTLFGAGGQSAQLTQALDAGALENRTQGVQMANNLLTALNLPANLRLQIEEQIKTLPVEELGMLAPMLATLAGLGQQGTAKQTGVQAGVGLKL
jgi:hypothetical protein